MEHKLSDSFVGQFGNVDDPRRQAGMRYPLLEIIFIAICAIIAGCDDWVAIERFGKAKIRWFKLYLPLKHGIPSHDTFGKVFAALDAEQFEEAFINWMKMVSTISGVVALDGKTIRRSFDKATGQAAIHMVTAWSHANRLIMGQVKVADKSNEITALPKLIQLLTVKGCLVTIDAMGTQTTIADLIIEQGGDYILSVKLNQKHLYEDISHLFKHATEGNFEQEQFDQDKTTEKGHGRIEVRNCQVVTHPDWLDYLRGRHNWRELKAVIKICRTRKRTKKKQQTETCYYLCSRQITARDALDAVRAHWGVENNVHWMLDVIFQEDMSRVRTKNAQQNLALMRRIAINLLNCETSRKDSMKGKRQLAGWDESYLEKVIFSN